MTQRIVNYTYGTGNPVLPDGSIDVRDGIDNLQSMDVFMNAPEDTYNQRDGEIVKTIAGAIKSVGFKPGSGDFTTGFTVMPGERDIAWYDPASKNWYSYLGVIPTGGLNLVPGTNPVGDVNWTPRTDELLRNELGRIVTTVNTASDIPSTLAVGTRVNTLGRYVVDKGPGEYVITAGTSPYNRVDPQIAPDRYAKLLPMRGTNCEFSLLAAGGKNTLNTDNATSTAINQLLAKIWSENSVFGGLIKAESGRYYLTDGIVRPAVGSKGIGIIGEYSPITYGTFESKTQFFFDNAMTGGYALDFYESQYVTLSDFSLRGDVGLSPARSGIRFGKEGTPQASGYANHLIERINVVNCYDCIFLKNSGISTLRDIQVGRFFGRGVTLETSGDSNLYNIYANDGNKDTIETSLGVGVGIYVGLGSNNVNVFGGKLEYNSKGFVSHGSNGVSLVGVQFDANNMANHIVKSINDGSQACRGNTAVGCRYLSGGVLAGYQKAGIYIDATAGSATLSISGGGLQSAGNGAYDSSTSGLIGPEVGIYALGNATYTLNVDGSGMVLESPGTVNAVVANGAGVRVKLSGIGGKKTVQELNGGKAHVGFYTERSDVIAFSATSGSATYLANSCDTVVVDGMATMDLILQLTANSGLTGNVTIGLLPYTNTGSNAAAVTFGMISSIGNVEYGMLGYVAPSDNKITLFKRNSDGTVSILQGVNLGANALLRMSVTMKVS